VGNFDVIKNHGFKQTADGQTAYYPFGFLGKGFIVDEPSANKIREQLKMYFFLYVLIGASSGILLADRSNSYFPSYLLRFLALILVAYGIQYFLYFWRIRPVLKNTPVCNERLKFLENLRYKAQKAGPDMVMATMIFFAFMTILSIVMTFIWGFTMLGCTIIFVFALFLLNSIYMYKHSENKTA
jgi:hypothetical protein